MIFHNHKYAVFLVVFFALFLRFWGIGFVTSYTIDEGMMVPSSERYVENGHSSPAPWMHPPLPFISIYATMRLLGDNPYGWRLRSALFGGLSVLMLFLLGRELLPDVKMAYLAALLLAVEPIHILLSRSTNCEITSLFYFITAVYITVRYLKGSIASPWLAGILLGMAIAERWYYLPSLAAILLFTVICKYRDGELTWTEIAHMGSIYIVLPVSIYLMTFLPWFQRGTSLSDFIQMQVDAYARLQSITLKTFYNPIMQLSPSSPWDWFTTAVMYGSQSEQAGGWGRFSLYMNNYPVWILTIPAFMYTAYRSIKLKDRYLALIVVLFVATYFQFILVKRPIFFYTSPVVLPLVYLLVAYAVVSSLKKVVHAEHYIAGIAAATTAWALYLYPLVVSLSVPIVLYAPVLMFARLY